MKNRIVISMMVLAMAGATLTGCSGSTETEVSTDVVTEEVTEDETTELGMSLAEAEGMTLDEVSALLAEHESTGYVEEVDDVYYYFSADGEFLCDDNYMLYLVDLANIEGAAIYENSIQDMFEEVGTLYTEGLGRPYVVFDSSLSDSEAQELVDAYVYEEEELEDTLYIVQYGGVGVIGVADYELFASSYTEVEDEVYDGNYEIRMDIMLEYDEACELIESSGVVAGSGEMYYIDADCNVSVVDRD